MSKFIISKDGIKRKLELPFKLCCQPQDLERLINALSAARREGGYGWYFVSIVDLLMDEEVNQTPREWKD